jgi:fatty-acyl-CoA synthase/long-chain acyl-CoA synthetase
MGYTSGTTGRPKGVYRKSPHTEMSVIVIRELGLRNDDVHLVVGPFYHAAPIAMAAREIMLGATIVIMKRMDAREFLETVEREKVSTAFMAPIHLRYLFGLTEHELAKRDVSSMRRIVVAGAPCPYEMKKRAVEYFGEGVLVEFYGSTDAGMNTVLMPEDQLRKAGSIGKPFPENEILVVDENDESLPPNQPGELLIYNPWLLDSYYNDPELTGKSFHGKYWRSGDIGYVDDEGYYYVVDRVKDMVISGGVNIYPVEIEEAILSHPKVFDCCVFGVPDKTYGEALKAVVQLRNGDEAIPEEIINWVGGKLADYKKPKSVEFAEILPRDQSGKIMKRYLRDQYWAGQQKKV